MPRYAVIDIGTNSVKFNISERRDDGSWSTVVDRADITRLGEGLQETGAISSDAMERTVAAELRARPATIREARAMPVKNAGHRDCVHAEGPDDRSSGADRELGGELLAVVW